MNVLASLFGGEPCHNFELRNCTSFRCRAIERFLLPFDALSS
jgi:hypothetical protein